MAHFGYRDGLSQPTVDGVPLSGLPDHLPRAPVGEFLLGYPSQFSGHSYPVPTPCALGVNGSFAALRVLEQDVDGFAEFLTRQAARTGMSEELRRGEAVRALAQRHAAGPLARHRYPRAADPAEALNDFDYVGEFGDDRGYRCPVGSHVRRMYPRGSRVAGNGGHRHRIVRRGIPYGPPYDPAHPRDGQPRGLLGLFIGASLADQFEFLMTRMAQRRHLRPRARPRPGPDGRCARAGGGHVLHPAPGWPDRAGRAAAVRDHPGRRLLFPAQHHRPALPGGPATGPEPARALMTGP